MATQGGEVRKLHIIYFISRMGHIEHPHLIRVHHLARNGVYLRDVKRWLGELRGKDMPGAFAWSYKRRYKTGYVWQDLLDNDLITPISDNEYVLKAYQFNPIHPFDKTLENDGSVSLGQKQLEAEHEKVKHKQSSHFQKQPDSKTNGPRKLSLNSDRESQFQSAMLTDLYDTFKPRGKLPGDEGNEKERESNLESSFRYMYKLSDKKNKDDRDKMDSSESSFSSSSSLQAPFAKNHSNEAAHWFRKLLSCRAVDTNDALQIKMNMANKPILNKPNNRQNPMTQISRKGNLGGSARVFDTTRNKQQQEQQHHNVSCKTLVKVAAASVEKM